MVNELRLGNMGKCNSSIKIKVELIKVVVIRLNMHFALQMFDIIPSP